MRVEFFAQLRDIVGANETQIEVAATATVRELLDAIYQRYPALRSWDKRIVVGAGVEFVDREYVIQPNESIAIMPPVQGG